MTRVYTHIVDVSLPPHTKGRAGVCRCFYAVLDIAKDYLSLEV